MPPLPTLADDGADPDRDEALRTILAAVPVIYDLLRATYEAWLVHDAAAADALVRLHGALVVMSLAELPAAEQAPVSRSFARLARQYGLSKRHVHWLDERIIEELTAVVRVQNRCSRRRQQQLAAVIATRLAAMDVRAVAAAA